MNLMVSKYFLDGFRKLQAPDIHTARGADDKPSVFCRAPAEEKECTFIEIVDPSDVHASLSTWAIEAALRGISTPNLVSSRPQRLPVPTRL